MERREALRISLGLAGYVGVAGWDGLSTVSGAQAPACSLSPHQTAGPFSEGRPGVPLKLALQVVDASSCAPVAGALVDVWHADAAGIYSGFGQVDLDASQEDFMRGIQVSDARGRVEFRTVYPGWYPGRATHVHFNVLLGERMAVTSQLYFPDSLSATVYEQAPYSNRGDNRTINATDVLGSVDLDALQMTVLRDGEGYSATHVIGIVTTATTVAPATWGWLKDRP